ncbi:MAG: pilus assembly PilX N-terminal domain-containing protein [Deltaproteobacteria bacterium]|nr:pilus assembly PilX N-terminal domain-containing protein [Deltaproteobacteria bacterium]
MSTERKDHRGINPFSRFLQKAGSAIFPPSSRMGDGPSRRCLREGEFSRNNNEEGTVLIVALLMLVMLTVIGISASTISNIEIQIAGNEKFYKIAFFSADGGTEAGAELLEQGIDKRGWPTATPSTPVTVSSASVYNGNFWSQMQEPITNDAAIAVTQPTGQIGLRIWGNTQLSTGGAIQLIAGYEGKGKGASGSGAYMVHNINSEARQVAAGSGATVAVMWRHMI